MSMEIKRARPQIEEFKNEEWEKQALSSARNHYLWISKIALKDLSDESLINFAKEIIRMLEDGDKLIKPESAYTDSARELILRIQTS